MSDILKDEQNLLEGYRQGKKFRSEFEELEKEENAQGYSIDREEILNYMNATGIDSVKKAHAKLYDLEPIGGQESKDEKSAPPITDFNELREKAHEYMEKRREANKNVPSTEVTGIKDADELRDKMREFIDKRNEERG